MLIAGVLHLTAAVVAQAPPRPDPAMSFFLTSRGRGFGGNLGGIRGADAHCAQLARAAGADQRTWRAYLSAPATSEQPAVHARDRIGRGPWFNAKGVLIRDPYVLVQRAGFDDHERWTHDPRMRRTVLVRLAPREMQ